MSDSIYLLNGDETLSEVTRMPYEAESLLQKLLEKHPELIPGALIDPDDPPKLILVKREAAVPKQEGVGGWWSADHLFLDQKGIPTIVEVKRSSDTRARREVVGQMLDYAANGAAYWQVSDLRAWFEAAQHAMDRDPDQELSALVGTEFDSQDSFWDRVEANLQEPRLRCVFVGDAIPSELVRLVEFMNEQLRTIEVLAVEIPQFVSADGGTTALVPRLIGKTARADAAKRRTKGDVWSYDRFMETLRKRSTTDAAVAEEIYKWMKDKAHCDRIGWGSGAKDGSMIAFVKREGPDQMDWGQIPFTIWTYGRVEIAFQYLKRYEPFSSEPLRVELLRRLNQIPGTDLPSESINRRPSIPLGNLHGDGMDLFLAAMKWTTETIRG